MSYLQIHQPELGVRMMGSNYTVSLYDIHKICNLLTSMLNPLGISHSSLALSSVFPALTLSISNKRSGLPV